MGYESRFFVVQKNDWKGYDEETKDLFYAEILASFDLCKLGSEFWNKMPKMKETDCYIYDLDGDTHILEDRYGEKLKEVSVDDLIPILEEEENKEHYRRFPYFIAMLKSIKEEIDRKEWDNVVVLHYGY